MNTTTLIQVDKGELNAFFAESAQRSLVERYAAVEVGTSTVCEIWGIAKETVSRYVKEEILTPLNPGSSKYRFRLSDVLAENPKYKHFKYNNHELLSM